MKLAEALAIAQKPATEGLEPFSLFLVCGFTPLHLQTFLAAHLRLAEPGRRVEVRTGLFGDGLGSLRRLATEPVAAGALVLEWADLDPRLGLRQTGGWKPSDLGDILDTVAARLDAYENAVGLASDRVGLAISLPSLPLPPISYTPGWQAGGFDLEVRHRIALFAARVARKASVRVVNPQRLDELSPAQDRLDVKSEMLSGFPYKVKHADALAGLLALLVRHRVPKKGLITDLDDTFWNGLVGEVGSQGVSWSMEHHTQVHGLYQQMLASLAEAGVLVAVASKNDASAVDEAFLRDDLILPRTQIFPLEVHWSPKSESVGRILRRWNVGADAVVFVDDSPLELAEVKAAHPDVECLLFDRKDQQAVYELLVRLRDLFGKDAVSEEDAIRSQSLRRDPPPDRGDETPSTDYETFLGSAGAILTVNIEASAADPRVLELINKTNQFNLNGRRFTEGAWRARFEEPGAFLLVASYADKFGPLGKIAVVSGRARDGVGSVDAWVMSCRAFSRRIEHACLGLLFRTLEVEEIALDFSATPKNGPMQEFLSRYNLNPGSADVRLTREAFEAACPLLELTIQGVLN